MFLHSRSPQLPTPEQALPGRAEPAFTVPDRHTVLGNPLLGPYPEGLDTADFGLGCFWGAERTFWQLPAGVWTTLAGYQGGHTEHPTYEEVCSGLTGHTEVVRVVFDPALISYERLLKTFRESHDPTQGFRQGNDVGTQYRSAIYTHSPEQEATAKSSREAYQKVLTSSGHGAITTEIVTAQGRPFLARHWHGTRQRARPHSHADLLASRRLTRIRASTPPRLGSHPGLPGPRPDEVPCLLDHLRGASR